jgi:cytidylate kinase
MAIVTVSRQMGSFGDEIARAAAEALDYLFIEKVQISEILSRSGLSISDIDLYDEKKPSIWRTLTIQKERFSHLIRAAMYELAARKNVVIVGRGGQVILKDIPGALHIRIIAPFTLRVARLIEQRGYKEYDAQRLIRQGDRDSSGYLGTYFDADPNSSELYDLVINTRGMTLDHCVELITHAVGTDGNKESTSTQVSEMLSDRALLHRAKAAVVEITAGGELMSLDVERGVVTLSGLVGSDSVSHGCEQAILKIPGIVSLHNRLGVQSKDGRIL